MQFLPQRNIQPIATPELWQGVSLDIPVLTRNITSDVWSFVVTNGIPVSWCLLQSSDGNPPWTQVDAGPYGQDINDSFAPGSFMVAQRGDVNLNPYGPMSNILVSN